MDYLEDGDIAKLADIDVSIACMDGALDERPIHLSVDAIEPGAHRQYMQNEIFGQPEELANLWLTRKRLYLLVGEVRL